MVLQNELLEIERGFWTGGPEYYRTHVDEICLLAFSGMTGIYGNAAIAKSVEGARWKDVEINPVGVVEMTAGAAILTYRALAMRDDAPYRALCSTGYVKREGGWKMAFHQQTRIDETA